MRRRNRDHGADGGADTGDAYGQRDGDASNTSTTPDAAPSKYTYVDVDGTAVGIIRKETQARVVILDAAGTRTELTHDNGIFRLAHVAIPYDVAVVFDGPFPESHIALDVATPKPIVGRRHYMNTAEDSETAVTATIAPSICASKQCRVYARARSVTFGPC